jgi:adenylate cyclase
MGMLRERRVLRVMAVYLVGAWLALQVADVALLPAVGVPEVGMRYLVIAACVGLVIAFVLSWRYQITSQGIARHEFRIGESSVPATLNRSDRWVIAALAGAALLVAGATTLKLADLAGSAQAVKEPVNVQPAPPGSLAVLPFANLSDDPQMDYLGEGLAEELLNRLGSVPSLRVTARTSAFSFKGQEGATVQEIGRMLGVAHVLEGSVRRAGNALRVTVQLVDTANGYRIWSSTYDRVLS